jgi:hypothetical protein
MHTLVLTINSFLNPFPLDKSSQSRRKVHLSTRSDDKKTNMSDITSLLPSAIREMKMENFHFSHGNFHQILSNSIQFGDRGTKITIYVVINQQFARKLRLFTINQYANSTSSHQFVVHYTPLLFAKVVRDEKRMAEKIYRSLVAFTPIQTSILSHTFNNFEPLIDIIYLINNLITGWAHTE